MSDTPKWSIRIDNENPEHVRVTIFQNGGNAGQLCIQRYALPELIAGLVNYEGWAEKMRTLEAQLDQAEIVTLDWAHSAGWATGHGDTIADILRELHLQHEAESKDPADLVVSRKTNDAD